MTLTDDNINTIYDMIEIDYANMSGLKPDEVKQREELLGKLRQLEREYGDTLVWGCAYVMCQAIALAGGDDDTEH